MEETRTSMVIYHDWLDSIFALMDDHTAVQTIKALQDYQRYGLEPDADAPAELKLVLGMAKSVIDTNEAKFKGGKRGGRPRKTKTEEIRKEEENREEEKKRAEREVAW